jgi:HEAT repeat protein/type 1 glutamine amidotransferase
MRAATRIPAVLLCALFAFAINAQQMPRRREVTADERRKIEVALPVQAPAKPRKPRKLLVVDYRAGHPSVPYADLAVELMGARTGAYITIISHDTSFLEAGKLHEFDAVYLNNTVGAIFTTPELREGFAAYIRDGGGLVANHGSSVASPDWAEFGEILGATGAAHRQADEKVFVKLDDPSHPVNTGFDRQGFEFTDEIFRFKPPSPRGQVHVLLSIDVTRTDMNQGRCTSNCVSEDGEYPISWVRSYGKGRVFYCSLGHNAHVFWDPRILHHILSGIQFAFGDLKADATPTVNATAITAALVPQPVKPGHTVAEMEPMLARLARYEYGQSRKPVAQLTLFVEDSMASPGLARQIETRMVQFLESDSTVAGKVAVSRELSVIASAASISVLTAMLVRPETAEIARYALARIPGPAADEALRKALDTTSGSTKVGVIHSLGQRRDSKAVPPLRSLLLSSDGGIAAAAIDALGSIGSRSALDALAEARSKVADPLRQQTLDAYLQCADRLAASGGSDEASKVYRQLMAGREPSLVRVAALRGLTIAEGKNAIQALSAVIGTKDIAVQSAAIRFLAGIPGPGSTAALMGQFHRLPESGQVRVLAALAERKDVVARPLFMQAARGNTTEVRAAALAGLGTVGDEPCVPLLAEAAASSQIAEQAAARQSLAVLHGPGIDAAIITAIGNTGGSAKRELILAAGERGSTAAADAVVRAAHEPDSELRRTALRALKNVAGAPQVPALLEMLKDSVAADRREVTQALASALKRSEPARIKEAVSAYKAESAPESRLALIEAMGLTHSSEVLPLLRGCLRDSRPEIVRGAILALTDWTDPAPLADLLSVAKTSPDPTLQILSLRGSLKLISEPSPRPVVESAELLAEAMRLARQPAEKKAVLALLPLYPCTEAVQLAEDSVSDPAVANEAKASGQRIRNALKAR